LEWLTDLNENEMLEACFSFFGGWEGEAERGGKRFTFRKSNEIHRSFLTDWLKIFPSRFISRRSAALRSFS